MEVLKTVSAGIRLIMSLPMNSGTVLLNPRPYSLPYSFRLSTNIAIDLGAIGISAWQIKRDLDAQEGRLARMEIGAKLAGLKVRLQVYALTAAMTCALSQFHGVSNHGDNKL